VLLTRPPTYNKITASETRNPKQHFPEAFSQDEISRENAGSKNWKKNIRGRSGDEKLSSQETDPKTSVDMIERKLTSRIKPDHLKKWKGKRKSENSYIVSDYGRKNSGDKPRIVRRWKTVFMRRKQKSKILPTKEKGSGVRITYPKTGDKKC